MSLPVSLDSYNEESACTVLHKIEGPYYVDYLVKGKTNHEFALSLAEGKPFAKYHSLWPTRWIVRVLTN